MLTKLVIVVLLGLSTVKTDDGEIDGKRTFYSKEMKESMFGVVYMFPSVRKCKHYQSDTVIIIKKNSSKIVHFVYIFRFYIVCGIIFFSKHDHKQRNK